MHQRRQQRQERKQEQAARPAEEKPVGGVSAHLDYDMEEMTGFVGQVSQHLYVGHFQTFSFEYFTNSPLSVNHPLSIEAQERGLTGILASLCYRFCLQPDFPAQPSYLVLSI